MAVKFSQHYNKRQTKQTEPIPGETQVQNNAGGYVYELDKWARLRRFLILGTDAGTYYVKEQKLTRDNALVVEACLADDAMRTINEITAISHEGRAPKNDQAIFALALAASVQNPDATGLASVAIRQMALGVLPNVCRIPTHLFQFMTHVKAQRGVSRMLRRALSDWYGRWDVNKLAYELVKYQQREGWAHRDILRQAHLTPKSEHQAALRWAVGASADQRPVMRWIGGSTTERPTSPQHVYEPVGDVPNIIAAFELAKTKPPKTILLRLIREQGLTREMVPTEVLNDPEVWEALLDKMPLTAMIRNLGKMTSIGLLQPLSTSDSLKRVVDALGSMEHLRRSRVHPLFILNAMRVYAAGHGDKGSLTWKPAQKIVDALDDAFYASFGNIEASGKQVMVALDVSASMSAPIAGTGLSCCEAASALALVTVRTEPGSAAFRFNVGLQPLEISPRMRLDDVLRQTRNINGGGTDCALPMQYATQHQLNIDGFVVYTDNETWAGKMHPSQALRAYRDSRNKPQAAEVVVGMTATEFTIADPKDPRTLDVVGFDLATPAAISEFLKG